MRQPTGWLMTLAIGVLLVLVLAGVLVLPQLLHPPLSARELEGVPSADRRIELQQAQAKLQDDTRATLLQGIAGLLLVAGAIATWRQVQVNRQGQITERFTRAIDQLGSDKDDVRVGGVYSLERIANDSPADRRTVQAVLAAVVRAHAPWPVGAPNGPEHPSPTVDEGLLWLHYRAPAVQAAMIVLGRRPRSPDELQLFLSRVDLRAAFLHGARLSYANLRHANLARSQMPRVDLVGADLDDIDLRRTNLRDARLTGANLQQAYLQEAALERADLRGANLRGANLRGTHLQGADLSEVQMPRSYVVDLVDVGRDGSRLRHTDLRDARLDAADLRQADLRRADLRGASLRGANLQGAQLEGADLSGVHTDEATAWPVGFQPG